MKPKSRFLSRRLSVFSGPAAILTLAAGFALPGHAADVVWTGASGADWADTTNWSPAALPTAADTVVFNASSTGTLSLSTTANRSILGLRIADPAGPVSINNNTLTLGKGGIDMSAATQNLSIPAAVTIASAGRQLWNVAPGRSISVAAIPNKPGVPAANAGSLQVSTTGTVTLGTTTANIVNDPQGNPWITFGTNDWAGLSNGQVVASTYTDATTALVGGQVNDVKASLTGANGTDIAALRFNEATPYDVTISNSSSTPRTATLRGILVTANSGGGSIGGNLRSNGFIRPSRSSTSGSSFNIIQNSSADLIVGANMSNASSNAPVRLVKSGPGRVISLQNNGYTGGTYIDQGTLQFGDGSAINEFVGYGRPGTGDIVNHGSLVMMRAAEETLANNISGTGSFTQAGPGVLNLTTSVSTFTGPVSITGGTLAVTSPANLGQGTEILINNGTFRFLGEFDPTTRNVTLGSAGATLDTGAFTITLAAPFVSGSSGSLTKAGSGTLALTATNNYSGGTTVAAGTLQANASSATGSGPVTVLNGASFTGTGSAPGAVSIQSGGRISGGVAGTVGTVTVGSLNLSAGATITVECAGPGSNDQIAVTSSNGLSVDGGAVTLFQQGGTIPFAQPGTYNLISHSGSIGGTGPSSLSIANPQAGFNYAFGQSGGFVTLTITASGVVSQWVTDGSGSWGSPANWSGATPNTQGATANFTTALGGAATITLDGARTVGSLVFNSANPYTLAPGSGGSLTLDNGSETSAIAINAGKHVIDTPLTLASNTSVTFLHAADSLDILGQLDGSANLAVSGPGTLTLASPNPSLSGALAVSGSTLAFASQGIGTGALSLDAANLVWLAGNTQDISDRAITLVAGSNRFDIGENNVTLSQAIGGGGTGALVKAGTGSLTLEGDNTFEGSLTIEAGEVRLGGGDVSGSVLASIVNNGLLTLNRSDDFTFSNTVSGTGGLTKDGSNTVTLSAANTFSGTTSILGGSLVLENALALQGSTLDLTAAGGSLQFGSLTNATLGALQGDRDLALQNDFIETPGPVALTVGGNGATTTYTGILSGSGSLTKAGAGDFTLESASTYTGATQVSAGNLFFPYNSSTDPLTTLNTTGTGRIAVTGGEVAAASANFGVGSAGFFLEDGSATIAGQVFAHGSTGNSSSALIRIQGGSFAAQDVILGRTTTGITTTSAPAGPAAAPDNLNLQITEGEVNIAGNLFIGTFNSQPNSTVVTRMNGGILTVGGAVSIGLNNGDRWSVLDVNGGEFISTGDTVDNGVVLGGPHQGRSAFLVRSGSATVERIQFGRGEIAGTGRVTVSGGELYVGAGGMVLGSTAPTFVPEILLQSGTLAAKDDWSTSLPVQLAATVTSVQVHAANAANAARDITLAGPITGTGTLAKTGPGMLTLSGGHGYTGETIIEEGVLRVTTNTFDDNATVTIDAGGTLNLAFSGGDRVGLFLVGSIQQPDGVYGAMDNPTPGITQTPAITGPGLLYVNTTVPEQSSAYTTWSNANGLTAGVNDGPQQDPDLDGLSNSLEFVLGGNPLLADAASRQPQVQAQGPNFVFTFQRSDASEAEITLTFQHGATLASWTDIAIGADTAASGAGVQITENADAPDSITITVPKNSAIRMFGRLRAVK